MNADNFDSNVFSDNLVAGWNYAKTYSYTCCCPGCKAKAIKSHLLQQHPVLASFCDEKNSLLQMVVNRMDPRSGNWDFYNRHKVGISIAMQYKLFCKKHDDSLFKDLEKRNSIPKSKLDCLLLAFRSACAVRHQEEQRLHIYEKQRMLIGSEDERAEISHSFMRRMDAVVNNLWETIIDGNGDDNYLFRLIEMPRIDIAVSDCMIDECDFEEHILDGEYNAPLNCLFINLIPNDDKLLLLLGCDTRYDKGGAYQSIIMGFPTGDMPLDHHLDTIKGILLKCSNWCCAPRLYDDSNWREFFDEYEELKVRSSLFA